MKRNNQQIPNEHAGALWVWFMCISAVISSFLLVTLVRAFFVYATHGMTDFPESYYVMCTLDCALVLFMLFVAKHWEMADDIKSAWSYLWRWALGYVAVIAVVLFCVSSGLFVALLVLALCSLSFVMLGERQARLDDIGKTIKCLAAGDFTAQVDESLMRGDLRELASDINRLAHVSSVAADERANALRLSLDAEQDKVRAERLRTELIANVSHDLKTPLTSVINYADLLSAELAIAPEGRDEDKLEECSDVLARQSVRLRKLIEDLIEASKAQTGNISVALAPLDASVLVAQAGGEWTERLNKQNIQLICTTFDEPLMINADGRQMGRIFDNILSNVSKYAMAGTRAYFSVQPSAEGGVEISCKNISATQLNISAEELLERFVRGDASRTTEGSGLGLSIAQSLMELQGGSLKLAIDADLFSVTLYFPRAATTADSSHALVASPAASASSTGSESRTE